MTDVAALGAYPKTVVLIDGAHLILRPVSSADAAAIAALERASASCDAPPLDPDRGPVRSATVVACDGERVVGTTTLAWVAEAMAGGRLATLGLRIDPAYAGRRLGTWMLLDVIHLAAALDVDLLMAQAPPEDQVYVAALRRLDFVEDAGLRLRHRVPDVPAGGRLVLTKAIHRAWTDF